MNDGVIHTINFQLNLSINQHFKDIRVKMRLIYKQKQIFAIAVSPPHFSTLVSARERLLEWRMLKDLK